MGVDTAVCTQVTSRDRGGHRCLQAWRGLSNGRGEENFQRNLVRSAKMSNFESCLYTNTTLQKHAFVRASPCPSSPAGASSRRATPSPPTRSPPRPPAPSTRRAGPGEGSAVGRGGARGGDILGGRDTAVCGRVTFSTGGGRTLFARGQHKIY